MIKNDTFLRALKRQPVEYTPIWIMRQAGRYLPEYRATRERAGSFLNLCKTPELACEVTLQPLARFALDAGIIFSDILTIPDAMNIGLYFTEGEGPKFQNPIRHAEDIQKLPMPDPHTELKYVMDAITLTKKSMNVPLIGFAGSPWTLATYMIEGGSSKTFGMIKKMMYCEPELLHQLLAHLTKATCLYVEAQVEAGADVIQIFDSWGGVLAPKDYPIFSLHYMSEIVRHLKKKYPDVPTILFAKGCGYLLEAISLTDCTAIGIDWTTAIDDAQQRVGQRVALQGNLDPCALYADEKKLTEEIKYVLDAYGVATGHVFNLGHGIHPNTDPGKVAFLVDAVHELSKILRASAIKL